MEKKFDGGIVMDNGSYKEYNEISNLKMHEKKDYDLFSVLRVPGGFIYIMKQSMSPCFVPLPQGSRI